MTPRSFARATRKQTKFLMPLAFFLVAQTKPLLAQAPRGPLPPPPASSESSAGAPAADSPAKRRILGGEESPLVSTPPPIPVEQIIQKFAQHEEDFRRERDNYTYTQSFVLQTIDDDGRPDGEFHQDSDILFTPAGKRYEKITYAPLSTLQRITMSQQDIDDLRNIQPFVLTTTELPKYNVTYAGRRHLDELYCYVFDVAPKKIEKDQRYFQGRVWVDEKDMAIVKSYGKAVPDFVNAGNRNYTGTNAIVKKGDENIFPRFETYRENITGPFWFPTYTHADDTLRFSQSPVRLRFTVKYTNYKRFGVTVKIGPATEVKQ